MLSYVLAHGEQLRLSEEGVAVLADAVQSEEVGLVVCTLAVKVEEGRGTFCDIARQGDSDHRHQYKNES